MSIGGVKLIEIKGIRKSFGDLQVLHGVDLHIEKGKFWISR